MPTSSVLWHIKCHVWLRAVYHTSARSTVEEFIYKLDPHNTLKTMEKWWARLGLNQRPLPCEDSALPLSYAPALRQETSYSGPRLRLSSSASVVSKLICLTASFNNIETQFPDHAGSRLAKTSSAARPGPGRTSGALLRLVQQSQPGGSQKVMPYYG